MSFKSDNWIAQRSRLENFALTLYYNEWAPRPTPFRVNLKDALEGTDVTAADLALIFATGRHVWISESTLTAYPALGKLKANLELLTPGCFISAMELGQSRAKLSPVIDDRDMCLPLIYPFTEKSTSTLTYRGKTGKCPSYGLTSYGYDIRLGNKFKICHGKKSPGRINMLDFLTCEDTVSEDHLYSDVEADCIELLPGQFMLGVSMEWVNMPGDLVATCMQKSSLARKGCMAFVTPLEPGWRGFITLEIVNHTEVTQRLYAGMGIMQVTFHEGSERCGVSYSDRSGKYMDQPAEPVLSLMK